MLVSVAQSKCKPRWGGDPRRTPATTLPPRCDRVICTYWGCRTALACNVVTATAAYRACSGDSRERPAHNKDNPERVCNLELHMNNCYLGKINPEIAGRFRYQQYVEKLHWEPENEYRIEFDGYDAYATHIALVDHDSVKAYCRLVEQELPCARYIQRQPARNSVEISRIISVRNDLRAMASVILYAARMADILGGDIYMLIEDKFARVLRRFGCSLEQVGGEVDLHGMRTPYRCNGFSVPKFLADVDAMVRGEIERAKPCSL